MNKTLLTGNLSETITVNVHFYDIDSLKIVWHGNYLKYLENSREAFGKKYGVGYMDIFNAGYIAPIVDLHIRYLQMVRIEETLSIEISYVPTNAAKLIFSYKICKISDQTTVAEATTTQLFMTHDGEMEFSMPDFYRNWKLKWDV